MDRETAERIVGGSIDDPKVVKPIAKLYDTPEPSDPSVDSAVNTDKWPAVDERIPEPINTIEDNQPSDKESSDLRHRRHVASDRISSRFPRNTAKSDSTNGWEEVPVMVLPYNQIECALKQINFLAREHSGIKFRLTVVYFCVLFMAGMIIGRVFSREG